MSGIEALIRTSHKGSTSSLEVIVVKGINLVSLIILNMLIRK
jgi:hypothetical protein